MLVGGRYRLVRPLGEGGMAAVWAAEHLTMGNLVAVKMISPDLVSHPIAIARFEREARAAAKLRTPYVVQTFDHDIDSVLGPYIAMELLEGESLADRMERERTLSPAVLSRIMSQVGRGVMRAHAAGIVHRDLKPENIFLVSDDEGSEIAKVLDFGVAKADSPLSVATTKTAAGTLIGTLNYMSPEQAQGKEVDHLADLWALGIIAFQALVGRRPFCTEAPGALLIEICVGRIPVPSTLNPDVPRGFDEWFARASQRDPALRFQSARELTRSLAAVCEPDTRGSFDSLSAEVPVANRPLPMRQPLRQGSPLNSPPAQATPSSPVRGQKKRKKKAVLQLVSSIAPPSATTGKLVLVSSDYPGLGEEQLQPPDPGYYVMWGNQTVGPIEFSVLHDSYCSGRVRPDALLWTQGWGEWKLASEVLDDPPAQRGDTHTTEGSGLLRIGPQCDAPPNAPAVGQRKRAVTLPAPGASVVSGTASGGTEPEYFLTESGVYVGPVRASVLRRGIEDARVPLSAVIWRAGWADWLSPAESMEELRMWDSAPTELLLNLPGIQAVGPTTTAPPGAPTAIVAPRTKS